MAEPLEVLDLIELIREFYGRDARGAWKFNPSDRASALWCDDLADLPLPELMLAFKQYRNGPGGEWPPSPGQLRQLVTAITRPALPTAADAWAEVLEAIRCVGSYGQPSFSHPLIDQAVRGMGGWKVMCGMEIDETATWRAQFRTMYDAYAGRREQAANLLPDVRAAAERNGALPAPIEAAPLALPAPAEPTRPAVEPTQPIKFAEYVAKWREAARVQREAEGRRKAEEGQSVSVVSG